MSDSASNFSPTPSPRPILTSGQQSVVDALLQRQTEKRPLAQWYMGAIRAMADDQNPDRLAQAAHSLRELMEKLPGVLQGEPVVGMANYKALRGAIRARLKKEDAGYPHCQWEGKPIGPNLASALTEVVSYLEKNEQLNRVERVATSIASLDPLFSSLSPDISKRKAETYQAVWLALQETAHHGSSEKELRECVEKIEQFILEVVAPVADTDRREIMAMLDAGPAAAGAANLMQKLIERRGANYVLFFQKVNEPGWLEHLRAAGHFANPPAAEPQDEQHVRWPYWWPVTLLPRLVGKAEGTVTQIARELPSTDNPQVLHEIAAVAAAAPSINQSLSLASCVLDYINARLPWQAWDVGQELVTKWSIAGNAAALTEALRLTRALLALEEAKPEDDRGPGRWPWPSAYRARCEPWQYRQLIFGALRDLVRAAPVQAAGMLAQKLRKIVRREHGLTSGQAVPWRDGTAFWCFDVSHAGPNEDDPRVLLVAALTKAGSAAIASNPSNTAEIVALLRRQPSQLFSRILWTVCAEHADALKATIVQEIIAAPFYGREPYDAEFQHLVRTGLEQHGSDLLDSSQRAAIFDRILAGPDRTKYEQFQGENTAGGQWATFKQKFQLLQFAPFRACIFGKYTDVFAVLSDQGKNVPCEAAYRRDFGGRGGTVQQRSPKSTDELAMLNDDQLVGFLNSWNAVGLHNGDFLIEISFHGLANAFGELVGRHPARFAAWGARWATLCRPIYTGAAIQAAEKLIRDGKHAQMESWLGLCDQVLRQPVAPVDDDDVTADDRPKWNSVRRNVCDFLEAAVDPKQPVPKLHAPILWQLVEALVTGPDPTLEKPHDARAGFGDAYSEAINRTRSRALEVAVATAAWFEKPALLQRLLAARFGGQPQLTVPERALLAVNFARIMALDAPWAEANAALFFPRQPLPEWAAILTDYLLYSRAYTDTWIAIKGELEHALKKLPALAPAGANHQRDQVAALGQHIFFYYLFGQTPLTGNDSLLQRYLTQAGPVKRAELFGHVGYLLHNATTVPAPVRSRIEAYFDARADAHDSKELENFTLWLGAKCLEPQWRLQSFLRLLSQPTAELSAYSEVSTLAELVPSEPALALECFAKITGAAHRHKHFYLKKECVEAILKVGLRSGDRAIRQNAEIALDNLLKLGRYEYVEGLDQKS